MTIIFIMCDISVDGMRFIITCRLVAYKIVKSRPGGVKQVLFVNNPALTERRNDRQAGAVRG